MRGPTSVTGTPTPTTAASLHTQPGLPARSPAPPLVTPHFLPFLLSLLLPFDTRLLSPITCLLPFYVHRIFSNIGLVSGNLRGSEGGHLFVKSKIWKTETARLQRPHPHPITPSRQPWSHFLHRQELEAAVPSESRGRMGRMVTAKRRWSRDAIGSGGGKLREGCSGVQLRWLK